jgi:hypothetical protein
MGQLGFFDADKRLAAISAKGDAVEKIDRVVPFERSPAHIHARCRANPAASQTEMPDWASQVAATCRKVCGTTSGPNPAAFPTDRKALLIFWTGSPFHSTIALFAKCSLSQRRRCVSRREGNLTGG